MMSQALLEARKRFRNQRGTLKTGFDNSPIPEGVYTCRVSKSEVVDTEIHGEVCPTHKMQMVIDVGDLAGRNVWPFPPRLDNPDGISQSANNIQRILGDVLPGRKLPSGEFELDYDRFLGVVEELAAKCTGEQVEVRIKDSPTKKRDDGLPKQNVFIQRGLGADSAAVEESAPKTPPPRTVVPKVIKRKR